MVVNELRYKTNIVGIGLVIQSLGLLCLSVVNTDWGEVIAGMDIVLSGSMRSS